jgi:hypothetical protein
MKASCTEKNVFHDLVLAGVNDLDKPKASGGREEKTEESLVYTFQVRTASIWN